MPSNTSSSQTRKLVRSSASPPMALPKMTAQRSRLNVRASAPGASLANTASWACRNASATATRANFWMASMAGSERGINRKRRGSKGS